eukprot:COSAG01_NODE_27575_length_682_cov_0.955403_1_plen_148_part_01
MCSTWGGVVSRKMGVRAPVPLTLLLLRMLATLGMMMMMMMMMGPMLGLSGGGAAASSAPRTPTAGAFEAALEGADDCGKSHDCATCTKNSSGCSWCQASTQCVKCSGAISCDVATKFKCTAEDMITASSQCPSDDNKKRGPRRRMSPQ